MAAIFTNAIQKRYGNTPVLNDISLQIESGEFFFLLGPSGCGKTTLLRIIAGLVPQDSGTVTIDGLSADAIPAHERKTPMVFQNYALWPHMTVGENVGFGLRFEKISAAEARDRIGYALQTVQLSTLSQRFPHELSGGQQQRVALARAIALKPRAILLDEPLSNLDTKLRNEMRSELRALHQKLKITFIYVTHDQHEALSLATRVAIMDRGTIAQVGTPEQIYFEPTSKFVATFIGETNIISGTVRATTAQAGALTAVDSELGLLNARSTLRTKAGDRVAILIRPEQIRVVDHKTKLQATITEKEFGGARTHLRCAVGSQCFLRVDSQSVLSDFKPGAAVNLELDEKQLWIMPQ